MLPGAEWCAEAETEGQRQVGGGALAKEAEGGGRRGAEWANEVGTNDLRHSPRVVGDARRSLGFIGETFEGVLGICHIYTDRIRWHGIKGQKH